MAKQPLHQYFNGVTKFGMLTLLGDATCSLSGKTMRRMVRVKCDCGVEKDCDAANLKGGKSASCGCQFKKVASDLAKICNGTEHEFLTVVGETRRIRVKDGKKMPIRMARCRCVCGKIIEVAPYDIRSKNTRSCGCQDLGGIGNRNKTHGGSKSPVYNIWSGMIRRCTNPKSASWEHYGGRGITVCERWLDFKTFEADVSPRPDGMSLERRDNNGNYCPENCEWATQREQTYNRRVVKRLTIAGKDISVPEVAYKTGVSADWMRKKMKGGMSGDEIINSVLVALEKLKNT